MSDSKLPAPSSRQEIEAFLRKAASLPAQRADGGRLIFALDATASREQLWDRASHIQARMFEAAGKVGGLQLQLCYYRGNSEFHTLPWTANAQALAQRMGDLRCRAGLTQIGRVLNHALAEHARQKIQAVVFVGDAVEEPPQLLSDLAGKLAILGIPLFLFQEGRDPDVEALFRKMARLTRGAYASFDEASHDRLRSLLCAVAVYASGGVKALKEYSLTQGQEVKALLQQLS